MFLYCCRYKGGFRGFPSSTVRSGSGGGVGGGVGGGGHFRVVSNGGSGGGGLCEVRRVYKAAVVPCKTGRRRARGMSMGQKVSGGVKSVGRDAAAPYKPVIPRELAQVPTTLCLSSQSKNLPNTPAQHIVFTHPCIM